MIYPPRWKLCLLFLPSFSLFNSVHFLYTHRLVRFTYLVLSEAHILQPKSFLTS
jgi:hypothetical protein